MGFKSEIIEYSQTGYFSKIVTDYLSQNDFLKNFYQHSFNLQGFKNAISDRIDFNTNRKLLVAELENQYKEIKLSDKLRSNISILLKENTFTVCTAHQPNIFTGHLYFIYKIIHTIKLADTLNREWPENNFIPVFYMGSEDADIDELGHIFINGEKYEWKTKQTGAVGRMIVDDELLTIIEEAKGQLLVEPFGKEIIELVKQCYVKGKTIQDACFHLVNQLFSEYGLLVLLPDNPELKRSMTSIFEDDIFHNTSSEIVNKTAAKLSKHYKVQAHPREINLFYLEDNIRERIIKINSGFRVHNTELKFTEDELKTELKNHPERFSPNVILRSLYQEAILPNIAFVGGGGELAYWLELKNVFQNYNIPYPVLILRNSFLLIEENINKLIKKLAIDNKQAFKPENELLNELVKEKTSHQLKLDEAKDQLNNVYHEIKNTAEKIDDTLANHVQSLLVKALAKIDNLEKKMLKAEKRNFEAEQRQIKKIRSVLFPGNELQERVENFIPFYARHGEDFIKIIYENSLSLEQKFNIISLDNKRK